MGKTFSIDKACQYLVTKAYPSYNKDTCGYCAKAIRSAVDFALEGENIEKKPSAKDYGPSYEKVGFEKILNDNLDNIKNYIPQKGDICILQPVKQIKDGKEIILHPHGHICMYTQKGWVSDFIQRDMPGGGLRKLNPQVTIYRYKSS